MEHQAVRSSDLHSVGYDTDTNTLEVQFHEGRIYQYFDVPLAVHQGLMGALSHGKYFAANIKNEYRCTRVK